MTEKSILFLVVACAGINAGFNVSERRGCPAHGQLHPAVPLFTAVFVVEFTGTGNVWEGNFRCKGAVVITGFQ